MAKQVKIKDIARMAGVSAGTVDRILHNRGNISPKSREAVERILAQVDYKFNIHTSAVSFRKQCNISICIPTCEDGEYWGTVKKGVEHALEEFSDINIHCEYYFYNQFDIYSYRNAFEDMIRHHSDGVIIGPTFEEDTIRLCKELDKEGTPYVFVDAIMDQTSPYETFTTDQYTCGYLLGKLLDLITPNDASLAIFKIERIGNQSSSNSLKRQKGFEDYMNESGKNGKLIEASLSITNSDDTERTLISFLNSHPDTKGLAVLNSRGYILADILHKNGIDDVKVMSFDLTDKNINHLQNGQISVLLCQKPELQGFNAIKSIINKLLYNSPADIVHHFIPIDIVFKENLPYYKEI